MPLGDRGRSMSGEYSFRSRFEDGPGANPEQLIAGAHASCFSMALAADLGKAGTPATSVTTDAVVTLRNIDGKATIATIALTTVGVVPGIDEAGLSGGGRGRQGELPGEPGPRGRARDHRQRIAGLATR